MHGTSTRKSSLTFISLIMQHCENGNTARSLLVFVKLSNCNSTYKYILRGFYASGHSVVQVRTFSYIHSLKRNRHNVKNWTLSFLKLWTCAVDCPQNGQNKGICKNEWKNGYSGPKHINISTALVAEKQSSTKPEPALIPPNWVKQIFQKIPGRLVEILIEGYLTLPATDSLRAFQIA